VTPQAAAANARPAPAARTNASGAPSVIGADLTITGNLESKGEVQVEGEVQGDIHAQRIVIGERARITGALIAEEIVVRGSVQGSIRGNAVTFQSSSRVSTSAPACQFHHIGISRRRPIALTRTFTSSTGTSSKGSKLRSITS
jgi:predicted acyltransferase (DUF342 family)